MRSFINIVEGQQGFVLDPRLDPQNYKITPSLGGASRWKAKILAANSAGEGQEIGDWDSVGYIMVSLTGNTIVPIARADEHHMGHDLLYDLGINSVDDKYLPLYAGGGNFVYGKNELSDLAIACQKWLSWGGPDLLIKGSNDLRGKAMYASQIKDQTSFDVDPTEIAPVGQRIIAAMDKLAQAFREAGDDPLRIKRLFPMVERFLKPFGEYVGMTMVGLNPDDYKAVMAKVQQARSEQNAQMLEEAVFGFSGFKNLIHQRVREVMRNPNALWSDKTYSVWGSDLSLANDRLGRF